MAGEEGLAVDLVVLLVGIEHAVEPGQQLLGAVVRVENNGDAVSRSNAADVVSGGDSTGNGSLLAIIADSLSRKVD